MGLFELMDSVGGADYEQVVHCRDARSGLRAIIAIHSTALGPALGGTRFRPYAAEEDALLDVLRLARAMSYKAAAAGLDLGGGKAVIIGDPATDKTEPLLRAYGRFVASLGGRYITAEDVGTTTADMDVIARETGHVTGRARLHGGGGDPSLMTAHGVRQGMLAVAEQLWGSADLQGRHVAIQGVGKVGSLLAGMLHADGARLSVADVNRDAAARVAADFGAEVVDPAKIHATACDILAPCALGAVVNDTTLPELACSAICGSANNVLERDDHDRALADAGVLYAPDFVVNAGGIINIADELGPSGYSEARARAAVDGIRGRLAAVLRRSAESGAPPAQVAEAMAAERMAEVSRLRLLRVLPGRAG
jgi:glutamate dehydrogenase/leucine dehydrogenase